MGNSTITLESVFDTIAAKNVPDPRLGASGFGDTMALEIATETMADIISERFNWKFNSAVATPFYTNGLQQDYPQLAQPRGPIGWGESVTLTDINNTSMPKPLWSTPDVSWRKELPPTSANLSAWRPSALCWMYNENLQLGLGAWPGPGVTYYPLITNGPTTQNPILYFVDTNENILTVTTFGVTGATAPAAPANAPEGTTVDDGSVVWTVVSPNSQGFRINTLPSPSGPTFEFLPTYQLEPVPFATFSQTLDPIPNSFARHFYRALESACYMASSNPGDLKRGQNAKIEAMNALMMAVKQGNRELDTYGLRPATSPVEERWQHGNMRTADNPYGY
jgi:hypothetical protein